MEKQVFEYIKKYNMIREGETVIAGVSGGADSICLLKLLEVFSKQMAFRIVVVHVEHGIRGEESLKDEQFVKELAQEMGVCYESFFYPVEEYAKKQHKSTEEMGRELRYRAFAKVKEQYHADKIAVAHHMDDQAETVLLNLSRGSGLKGLGGMLPVRTDIIRPLLCVSKKEIQQYLKERQIFYREDYTNKLEDYARNKIRLKVLPYMEKHINERCAQHIFLAAQRLRQAQDYVQMQVEAAYEKCVEKKEESFVVNCKELKEYPPFLIKELLLKTIGCAAGKQKDITAVHVETVFELLSMDGEKACSLPYGIEARKSYQELRIGKPHKYSKKEVCITPELPGEYTIPMEGETYVISFTLQNIFKDIPKKRYTKWFAYDKIKNTLQIRTRKPGDYLVVDEAGKKQKLKSYFINEKIPRQEREQILLLADGSHILWVIGYRISADVKVRDSTKKILKVQVTGGKDNG